VETDHTRALVWMIGLPDITFLAVEDGPGGVGKIHVEIVARTVACPWCGVPAQEKDRTRVELVDLSLQGRPIRLVWRKRRWMCRDGDCSMGSWTEDDDRIAGPCQLVTSRAARWATRQVGKHARSVNELTIEFGCNWHTVNDTVVNCGKALLEADDDRIGEVTALGLDEVYMVRVGPYHHQHFSTQLVDVRAAQLLAIVPGRGSAEPMGWLAEQGRMFRDRIEFGTLDLCGPYRRVFEVMVSGATLVADPFHVCKLANTKLDECRRRVQNATLGHRAWKSDPLYRYRRLLTKAKERLDDKGSEKLKGLLWAGHPNGDVATCWEAKGVVRDSYVHADAEVAVEWVTQLGRDLQDKDYPIAARSLGRTLIRWRHQIAAWHLAHVSNGPTEAVNNLIKRVKRAAFRFTSFRNYRIRSLLCAGKPNWDLLATVTPC